MSEFICFLITFARIVPYDPEAGQASELIKVALKVHRDDLPSADAAEYPRECEANLRLMLPKHCKNLGPIVDIEVIAEVAVVGREDPDRWLPYDDHSKLEKRWYDVRSPGGEVWEHYWPNAGQLTCARGTEQVRVPPNAGFEVRPSKNAPEDLQEKPPGPASPPRPKPHHEEPGEVVVMHERAPTCYWHAGCACDPWPPMRPVGQSDEQHVRLECTHCHRVAAKPRNQAGFVRCSEVTP